ncbi:MAG TPA: ThuA domain-containing protein, partial [Chloroflexota bacterium]|nr:ThuA domain-containing protein [Chloroflexota bacterium]
MDIYDAGQLLLVALLMVHCSDGTVNHALNAGAGGSISPATSGVAGLPIGSSDMGAGGDSTVTESSGAGGSSDMPPAGTGGIAGSSVISQDASVDEGRPDVAVDSSAPTGDMRSGPFKMLIFSWTTGFHHDSIPTAQLMASAIGASNPIQTFTVDIANANALDPTGSCEDNGGPGTPQMPIPGCNASVSMFTDDNLKNYEIVFFANPTGDDFSRSGAVGTAAKAALEKWMNNGGAYIGVHSATDFEKGGNWTFYNDMLGALFDHHDGDGTAGTVVIQDAVVNHPVVRGLAKNYQTQDEWYFQLRNPEGRPGITILAKLAADQRPVTWIHEFPGGGRMVYTI